MYRRLSSEFELSEKFELLDKFELIKFEFNKFE